MRQKTPKSQGESGKKKKFGGRQPGAGRPLGSVSLKGAFDAISQALYGPVKFPGGVTRMLTGYEKLALAIFQRAVRSDRAAEIVFDRKEGKALQTTMQLGDEKRSLRIVIDHRKEGEKAPNEEGDDGKKDEEKP